MTSGILLIDKESGISSAKCVYMLRKKLSIKKIGHAGTLDPLATGLLPLLIGKATRVSDFLMDEVKVYETLAFFGKKTNSQDKTGEIIDKSSNIFNKKDLKEAIKNNFIGDIEQTPPMYSALKHNGRKLYEIAREGKTVERKKRNIKIFEFEILSFNFPYARFRIKCSKGTYIRTLVNDLGEALKTFANVYELRRLEVGDFHIKDSIKSDDIKNLSIEDIKEKIIPIDKALLNMKEIRLNKSFLKKATNGMAIKLSNKEDKEEIRVYVEDDFIGIGKIENNLLKLKKVFYEW